MRLKIINTIFRKDLQDAIRDARVLVAILVPFGIGIFYNLTFDDDSTTPKATVMVLAAGQTELPATIQAVAGDAIEITYLVAESEAELQQTVADEDADLGLIIPAGFDAEIAAGSQPTVTVIRPPGTHFGGDYVAAALEPALRQMAGQQPPATIETTAVTEDMASRSVVDRIGLRKWAVFAAIVMMIAMISMLAVPVILAEETEKKTLDALVLIASYPEIIAAKALVGVAYVAVMVPLLLAITQLRPVDIGVFAAASAVLSVTLIGCGLLLAGFFKNANQLNTWSGVILLPVIAPAFTVGLGAPKLIDQIASLFPTGAATKLLLDSASQEALFSAPLVSFLIIVVWGLAAYGLLTWRLSSREA